MGNCADKENAGVHFASEAKADEKASALSSSNRQIFGSIVPQTQELSSKSSKQHLTDESMLVEDFELGDGVVYQGSTVRGLPHGKGQMTMVNGEVYKGFFVMGKKHGIGSLEKPGEFSVTGEWKNDRLNGFGVKFWQDGRQYKGRFVDGEEVEDVLIESEEGEDMKSETLVA